MDVIDVAKILERKNPKMAARLPHFVVSWLERLVHQDELNYMLAAFSDRTPMEFIKSSLDYMNIAWMSEGLERLDKHGRYVFASNHPFGGLDGLMLAWEVYNKLGEVKIVVNDILMNIEPLKPLFVPVNKHGGQSYDSVEAFKAAFESDCQIVTFPAGLCSRRNRGVVDDLEWKNNFVKRAITSGRDIVPVYFDGRLSDRFYRIAWLRKFLRIKINIEMLFLVDEMFRQGGSEFIIKIGEPVDCLTLKQGRSLSQMTDYVRHEVYNLRND